MSIPTEVIQTYEVGYSDISRQFSAIEQNLRQTAAHGHTATVSALEISMTKLFKVALFVHREADTDENGVRIKELLAQAVAAFKQVETTAESAYDQIAGFHTQVCFTKIFDHTFSQVYSS